MKASPINSVYTVTEVRSGKVHEGLIVQGTGQEPIKWLRKQYPRLSRFILEGFMINGNYKALVL